MVKFDNPYLQSAIEVLQERKEVIKFTYTEQQLYDVLSKRREKDVLEFLRENPSFNEIIASLQR